MPLLSKETARRRAKKEGGVNVRIFVYDNREFPDPDPDLTVDEVRQHMSNFFPELSNAETKQSKRGEDDVIEFKRRTGTKGD